MEKKTTTIKKPTAVKKVAKPVNAAPKANSAGDTYIEAVGRRKTSVARVRIYVKRAHKGGWEVIINEKPFTKFFTTPKHQQIILQSFQTAGENFPATIHVSGGGVNSQAEAIRLGIARTLVKLEATHRSKLKALGYLKRDPRMVEAKKYGSRKARRPQQWRKR
jgi:small subunit ribosomal protein S9